MSGWKKYRLGDIADVQTGPFGSQLHMKDYVSEGTPIITVEHLGENRIVHENLPRVSATDRERLKKYVMKEGDIIFSRVGSVDRRAFVSKAEDGWMFSGRCLRVRVNGIIIDPKFLSYFFGQETFKEHIRRVAVGATMPSINTQILSDVVITVPSFQEQASIKEVLDSFDNKIDLLHQQNQTLEQMAETLYRQWFEKSNAETCKLSDVLELNYGKALKEQDRKSGPYPVVGSSGIVGVHDNFVVEGPGIVTGRKGTLGVVTYLFDNFYPIDTTFYITSRIQSRGLYYEYFLLKSLDIEHMNTDSAVPGLNRNIAMSTEIPSPKSERVENFNDFCHPFFEKLRENDKQIKNLVQLRDTLLPKLMSGEVRVNETKTTEHERNHNILQPA